MKPSNALLRQKTVQMVGRFVAILFMVAWSSSCLGLLNWIQETSLNGGSPLNRAGYGKTAKVMGVELRMTDKKKMAGSCDFLIQMPDKSIVLGDLKDHVQREGNQGTQASNRTA